MINVCKKCGEQPYLITRYTNGMHYFAYGCLSCQSSTPFSSIKEVAEANWQKRNKREKNKEERGS